MLKNKAIFWDRDGVVNKVITRNGKPSSPWEIGEFEIFSGVMQVMEDFKKIGFLNIIFTNQPDVSRGFMKIAELEKMHEFLLETLPINEIKFCPHDDKDNCSCRKPKPGMLLEAAEKWGIDFKKSFVIGDSSKDIKAGKITGCKTFLLSREYNKDSDVKSDFLINDIGETLKIIKNNKK